MELVKEYFYVFFPHYYCVEVILGSILDDIPE